MAAPYIVAVDLAAKYSAVCRMRLHDYAVISEFDSWGLHEDGFLRALSASWYANEPPALMVVEDLPHRLPFAALVKQVCRMQGRIVDRAIETGNRDKIVFVPPAVWRNTHPALRPHGVGPEGVIATAIECGYNPPDLAARANGVKGGKAIARKVVSDYCAAYLIALWAAERYSGEGLFEAEGTTRYDTALIRKKRS